MIVLGLNHGSHDAAAALMIDGEIAAFVQQEQLSGRRYAIGESPLDAACECLSIASISWPDVDVVALGSDHEELARQLRIPATEVEAQLPFDPMPRLRRAGLPDIPVTTVPHHLAHAHSAFWPSQFESAGILVVDAMGEAFSTSVGSGSSRDGIELEGLHGIDQSLGYFYEAACAYVGFDKHSAGKLMGLAAYGEPHGFLSDMPAHEAMDGLADNSLTGKARVLSTFEALLSQFQREYYPFHIPSDSRDCLAYADFAASAQRSLELSIVSLAHQAVEASGSRRLVLAGGVALNCAANGVVARSGLADDIFVQPASTDAGVALGAALSVQRLSTSQPFSPYLGPEDLKSDMALALKGLESTSFTVDCLDSDDLCHRVAVALADGSVVAWHQGRAEVGPRALGARSLLADPRTRRSVSTLNSIKSRDQWRPIAPSVKLSAFDRYFDGHPNPFMIVAANVRVERRAEICAVVHVDGTARPQVVEPSLNPLFDHLLTSFESLTGCPVLANTSLNAAGRAPSARAHGTVDFFAGAHQIDHLALGPFFVSRIK